MNPSPIAFTVAGFSVRWYGLMIALGIALGIGLAMARERRYGLPRDTVVDLALCGVPAAIVGARLYYVIFSWPTYAKNPISALYLWEGGLAIYGGILGGLLAGLLYARKKGLRFLTLADLVAPSFAIGQAVGRWGNFFNQEAYGVAVTNPALQRFPVAVFIQQDGLWHCATFFLRIHLVPHGVRRPAAARAPRQLQAPRRRLPHLRAPLRRGARPRGGPAHRQPLLGPRSGLSGLERACGRGRRYTADRAKEEALKVESGALNSG